MSEIIRRVLNIAVALDQLLWTLITLGNGSPDETISAALWRMEQQGKLAGRVFRPVVDRLLWFDKNHCYESWLSERNGRQLDESYRTGA